MRLASLSAAAGKDPAPPQPPLEADRGTLVLRSPRSPATFFSRLWSRLGDGTLVVALLALTLFAPAAYLAVRHVAHGSGVGGRAHAARGGSLPVGHGLVAGDFVSTCYRDGARAGPAPRAVRRALASGELHMWLRKDENIVLARGCAPADRGDVLWASNTNSPDVAAAGPREGPLVLQHEARALVLRDAVNGRVVWRRRVQALPLVLREAVIADWRATPLSVFLYYPFFASSACLCRDFPQETWIAVTAEGPPPHRRQHTEPLTKTPCGEQVRAPSPADRRVSRSCESQRISSCFSA